MSALLLLSSIPGDAPPDNLIGTVFHWVPPAWQNLLHLPLYAGLTASWLWALTRYPLSHGYRLGISFLLTALWAIIDETYQTGVPGRYGSLTDLAINTAGAAFTVVYAARRISSAA